jgi:hypothetical protein
MAPPQTPATAKSKKTNSHVKESDLASNEALLQHAEASKLAKSWLNDAFGAADDDDDVEREEKHLNAAFGNPAQYSETYVTFPFILLGRVLRADKSDACSGGLGFQEAAEPISTSRAVRDSTTAFLRKQLLPRGSGRPHPRSAASDLRRGTGRGRGSGPDSSGDEEEGRSGLGKGAKRKRNMQVGVNQIQPTSVSETLMAQTKKAQTDVIEDADTQNLQASARTGKKQKRGSSYLDEILASRAAKKKKKVNNNNPD